MRHRKHKNTLSRREGHRKALVNNLAISLIKNNRIMTTHKKAKVASQFTDRLITIAKEKDLNARRKLFSYLKSRELVKYLVDDLAPRFEKRNGGYTRVLKYKNRVGDGAMMAILEFTEIPEVVTDKKKKGKKAKKPKLPVSEKKKEAKEDAEEAEKGSEKKGFFKKLKKNLKKK